MPSGTYRESQYYLKKYNSISPTLGTGTGEYAHYQPVTMIARNGAVGTTRQIIAEAIPAGLDISFPSSATILSITSDNANDTSAGTGAGSILILGLDSNRIAQTEIVALNGLTPVLTTNSFLRINQMIVLSSNNGANDVANTGNIYCSITGETYASGIPTTTLYNTIGAGTGISMVGIYSTPSNIDRAVGIRFSYSTDTQLANPVKVNVNSQNLGFPPAITAYTSISIASAEVNLIDAGDGLPPSADTWLDGLVGTGTSDIIVYYTFTLKYN